MLSVKSIGAMLAAATFGTALLTMSAAPAAAQAGYHGGWGGGTRYVNRSYGYAAPAYGYAAQSYYAPRAVVATNACGYVQRRAWIEGEGWRRFTRYECDY